MFLQKSRTHPTCQHLACIRPHKLDLPTGNFGLAEIRGRRNLHRRCCCYSRRPPVAVAQNCRCYRRSTQGKEHRFWIAVVGCHPIVFCVVPIDRCLDHTFEGLQRCKTFCFDAPTHYCLLLKDDPAEGGLGEHVHLGLQHRGSDWGHRDHRRLACCNLAPCNLVRCNLRNSFVTWSRSLAEASHPTLYLNKNIY